MGPWRGGCKPRGHTRTRESEKGSEKVSLKYFVEGS